MADTQHLPLEDEANNIYFYQKHLQSQWFLTKQDLNHLPRGNRNDNMKTKWRSDQSINDSGY